MSRLVVVKPPFRFQESMEELNMIFKPVENFEMMYYVDSLSESTNYCFNIVGVICSLIKTRGHTGELEERYAIMEEVMIESFKQYKVKIDEIKGSAIQRIEQRLEELKKIINNSIKKIQNEYREWQKKIENRIKKIEEFNQLREKFIRYYQKLKKSIDILVKGMKNNFSCYNEYNLLCDEYTKITKKFIEIAKA